jgi:hypothetical protein
MIAVAAYAYAAENTTHWCGEMLAYQEGSGCEALNRECGIGTAECGMGREAKRRTIFSQSLPEQPYNGSA